jgi:hypothetical protein
VLDQGREEDGPGMVAFLEARLALQPVPIIGVYLGGILQGLNGLGQNTGGHSLGLNLGVQLRSLGW